MTAALVTLHGVVEQPQLEQTPDAAAKADAGFQRFMTTAIRTLTTLRRRTRS